MKKLLLLGTTLMTFGLTTSAQDMVMNDEITESKTEFGAEAGVLFNSFMNDYPDNFISGNQIKVGFYIGGIADFKLGEHISFQPGIQYAMKGAQEENTFDLVDQPMAGQVLHSEEKNKITLHYIQVPLNFLYRFGQPMDNHFFVGVGPYISYLASASNKYKIKQEVLANGTNTNLPEQEGTQDLGVGDDQADNFNTLDVGANAFIGYQLESGLFFKAGGSVGLINVVPENPVRFYNVATNNDFKTKNYNWSVGIGWLF